jgi:hypothetical protein
MATIVSTKELSGVPVEVKVDHYGRFYIHDEEGVTLGTGMLLDSAESAARQALAKRKVRVEVAFITHDGQTGVAHGLHAKTNKILGRINGKAVQIESYRRDCFQPDIPRDTMNKIEKDWQIDLRDEIEAAIKEKAEIVEVKK